MFNRQEVAKSRVSVYTAGQRSSTFIQCRHRRLGLISQWVLLGAQKTGFSGTWSKMRGKFVIKSKFCSQHEKTTGNLVFPLLQSCLPHCWTAMQVFSQIHSAGHKEEKKAEPCAFSFHPEPMMLQLYKHFTLSSDSTFFQGQGKTNYFISLHRSRLIGSRWSVNNSKTAFAVSMTTAGNMGCTWGRYRRLP